MDSDLNLGPHSLPMQPYRLRMGPHEGLTGRTAERNSAWK